MSANPAAAATGVDPAAAAAAAGVDPAAAAAAAAGVDTAAPVESDDEDMDEQHRLRQKDYAETPINEQERQDYPSIFSDEVDEIIDILSNEGKIEQYQKLQRDLRNCRDTLQNINGHQFLCDLAKKIMDKNVTYERNKNYQDEVTKETLKTLIPKRDDEDDASYESEIEQHFAVIDNAYKEALKIGYKNTDYFTNKYRAGTNATNANDNFKPYFALELMYELLELEKQELEKIYNKHVVKKVKHSEYTENTFAIFPYKRRLHDLLTNQCRKSDLINWKSVLESEYKLHRHNPNERKKRLEADYLSGVLTYKRNIARKHMMEFYDYINVDDDRKGLSGSKGKAEMLRLYFKYFNRNDVLTLGDSSNVVDLEDMAVLIDDIIGVKSGYSISLANSIRLIPDRIMNQGKEGTTLKRFGNALGITSRAPISSEDQDAAAARAGERQEYNRTHNFLGFRRSEADPNAPAPQGTLKRFFGLGRAPSGPGGKMTKQKKRIKFKTRKRR